MGFVTSAQASDPPKLGQLLDRGGPVQTGITVYVDFWGWSSDPPLPGSGGQREPSQQYLSGFLSSVGNSRWLYTVNQYGASSNLVFGGAWSDPSPVPSSLTDDDLAQEAVKTGGHYGFGNYFSAADSHIQVVVATPPGVLAAESGACAYHSYIANLTYTDLPYAPSEKGCGSTGTLDDISLVEGHELSETLTDPYGDAWRDSSGEEIADKCEGQNPLNALVDTGSPSGPFKVQPLWSNRVGGCVLSAYASYVKYPWASGIYGTSLNAYATVQYVDATAWYWAGNPTPTVVYAISGDKVIRYRTSSSELFLVPPPGTGQPLHHLTLPEWQANGSRTPAQNQGAFYKTASDPTIYYCAGPRSSFYFPSAISYAEWQMDGFPTPQVVSNVTC